MLTLYMLFWSLVTMIFSGIGRARSWEQIRGALFITAILLLSSQYIFAQLSLSIGIPPNMVLLDPARYLVSGPVGWLALLIMPIGWISPLLALQILPRNVSNSAEK